jgi:O-antigen chain-terminating methyltransferase
MSASKYLDITHAGPPEHKVRELYEPLLRYFDGCRLVLDVGCGRGIVLSLLSERGIAALGCDSESEMVAMCRDRGLECIQADVLEFLRSTQVRPDGICCGHLIEHLPPLAALDLVALCHERLSSGGILLVVTPNPADLRVLAHHFWMDLTHLRPYPAKLIEEMLTHVGFSIVASHDAVPDSLQSKTGLKRAAGTVFKWAVTKIVGIDIVLRGDTVVVARKP